MALFKWLVYRATFPCYKMMMRYDDDDDDNDDDDDDDADGGGGGGGGGQRISGSKNKKHWYKSMVIYLSIYSA